MVLRASSEKKIETVNQCVVIRKIKTRIYIRKTYIRKTLKKVHLL